MNSNRRFTLLLLGLLALPSFLAIRASDPDTTLKQRIILTMPGKGSSVAFDFGVITRLTESLPMLQQDQVILTGSSSGGVVAGFFALRGINADSLRQAKQLNDLFDRTAIRQNEEVNEKLRKLIANQPTEMDHETLRRAVACVLGVDTVKSNLTIAEIAKLSTLTFKLPVAIVAANHEVLWDREPASAFKSRGQKTVDHDTYSVSWKPEVLTYYQKNPARFATDHPDLVLGKNPSLGKACTYFVTEDLYQALIRIPGTERLGDLRVMKTPADLVLAMLASASEPTYYRPIVESDYAKLHAGDALGDRGHSKRRLYAGGFIMPVVAHDLRRVYPLSTVISTGSLGYPAQARQLLQTWYAVDHLIIQRQNDYWIDFSTQPSDQTTRKIAFRDLAVADEFRLGYDNADQHLKTATGALPKNIIKPRHRHPIGLTPANPLLTMRGLDALLTPSD